MYHCHPKFRVSLTALNIHLRNFLIPCLFGFSILFYSCKDDEYIEPLPSAGERFFPLYEGFWVEYETDSIIHLDDDDASQIDTSIISYHYYIREEIDSSFIDSENERAYVVLRYKRFSDTLSWELSDVWTAKVDLFAAERVEDNIRFIRLKFPVSSSTFWNGNAFNFFPVEEYSYDELYRQRIFNSLQFDSTITVVQNDFVSNVNRITKKEIYGTQAGLLYKQLDSVRTLNTGQGTIILNGLEFRQEITDYKR